MQRSRFGNWLLGLLLTFGFAAIWLLVATLIGQWFVQRSWMKSLTVGSTTTLVMQSNGQPLLMRGIWQQTAAGAASHEVKFEGLDGKTIERQNEITYANSVACNVNHPNRRIVVARSFLQANSVMSRADFHEMEPQLPVVIYAGQAVWYFMRSKGRDAPGYFVGYELQSKQRIGYISQQGLSSELPQAEDCFSVFDSQTSREAELLTRVDYLGDGVPRAQAIELFDAQPTFHPVMQLWSPDRRRVFQIDLLRHQTTVARDFGDDLPLSISMLPQQDASHRPLPPKGIVSFADRLEITDATLAPTRTIPLPEEFQSQSFTLYDTTAGFVLQVYDSRAATPAGVGTNTLVWLDDSGAVTRRESVVTENTVNQIVSASWMYQLGDGLALIPALRLLEMLKAPNELAATEHAADPSASAIASLTVKRYFELMARYFRNAWTLGSWWVLLTAGIAGLVAAVVCCRCERSRGASTAEQAGWALVGFLFGPAGCLGYVAQRPRDFRAG